ncbi:MAG: hypothetical protein CBC76_05600 [Flavobacteriaceae bacterium TMED116]|nr:MAG: hypothetical protein CBC76_05600 [Flavobacteriaceae bacterium TMED116]OUX34887.1 MAG: hypothetical protein CBE24_00490 [bacterium TMED264]|tara:strand:+ start:2412 stop:2894 length:483 start_codon:yes stop_codon:yes gene_type:complete
MKKYLITLLIINFFSLGCENQKNITDDQVINIVREFFDAFDVNNKDRDKNLSKIVTDDFIICELGKFYKLDEFLDLVDPMLSSMISTSWNLTDHVVTIDNGIAHSFHNNSGVFTNVDENGVKTNTHMKWLESALVVNEQGSLKLKYYQSENISSKVDTIQ